MDDDLCGEFASFRFTWPGKPETTYCLDHAMKLQGVAAAIGLPLQLIVLSYKVGEVPDEMPICTHKKDPDKKDR